MKYRKKPVVIEALELKFSTESQDEIIQWSNNTIQKGLDGGLRIPTLEGIMVANTGDYIIRGVKGEFYPCKPNIFKMTYELASTSSQTDENGKPLTYWGGKQNKVMRIDDINAMADADIRENEINKLAEEVYGKDVNQDYEEGFVDGYNKAKETLYTEEQMIGFANWCRIHDKKFPNEVWTIQQLQTKYYKETFKKY